MATVINTATGMATRQPTSTPNPTCTLVALPLFSSIPQGFAQAVGYGTAASANVTTTFVAGTPPYPSSATLAMPQPNVSITFVTVFRTLVNGNYQYTFNTGPLGAAALGRNIPSNAQLGTVTVKTTAAASCGTVQKTTTFQATSATMPSAQQSAPAHSARLAAATLVQMVAKRTAQ